MLLFLRYVQQGGSVYVLQAQPVTQHAGINQPISFGKEPVRAKCQHCTAEIFTRVDNRISSGGKCWAILCCCLGSWLLSFLVLCMDGFKEFTHFCPSCNRYLATYNPTFSGGAILGLILLTILVIGFQAAFFFFYVLPMINERGYRG